MASLRLYCYDVTRMLSLYLIPVILAWGERGHYSTCKIAEGYLTEEARDGVKELLPESAEGQLAAVCSWPDLPEIRQGYPWSRELHFADTPDYDCTFDYFRDCHDSANQKNRCVIGAIYNYTGQLKSAHNHYGGNKYNLTEALMFVSHFMGDLHQPLHLGFLGDLGGNRVKVQWYNESTNLHRVWDDKIIDTAVERYYGSNLTNFIEAISRNITESWSSETRHRRGCHHSICLNQYGAESISLACEYAYKNAANGSQLHTCLYRENRN